MDNIITGADRITEIRRLKLKDLPTTIAKTQKDIAGLNAAIEQLEKAHAQGITPSQVDQLIALRRQVQRREQDLVKEQRELNQVQAQEYGKGRARLMEIDRLIPELETERERLRAKFPMEEMA